MARNTIPWSSSIWFQATRAKGKVLKTLLDKLEAMRRQLQSDKVFDVVGRLFEGVSMKEYLEQAVTKDAETVVQTIGRTR